MSEIEYTRCEFTREVLSSALQVRKKAAANWAGPLASAYAQVALELRRVLERHAKKCAVCLEEDALRDATVNPPSKRLPPRSFAPRRAVNRIAGVRG